MTTWSEWFIPNVTSWYNALDIWLASLLLLGFLLYVATRPSLICLTVCSVMALGILVQSVLRRLLAVVTSAILLDLFSSSVLYLGSLVAFLSLDMIFNRRLWAVVGGLWVATEAFLLALYFMTTDATPPQMAEMAPVASCLMQVLASMAVQKLRPEWFEHRSFLTDMDSSDDQYMPARTVDASGMASFDHDTTA